ncbi:MAG: hypothetical protein RR681_10125, partial [Lachnospiraceae bacterium]
INLDDETEIVPQLFSDELVIPPPTQMRYLHSHLIFMTPNVSSCMLIMNEKTKKTVVWGRLVMVRIVSDPLFHNFVKKEVGKDRSNYDL